MRRSGVGLHSTGGRMVAVAAGLLLLLVAGCSGGGGGDNKTPPSKAANVDSNDGTGNAGVDPGAAGGPTPTPVVPLAKVSVKPANGAQEVAVSSPVTVTAAGGTLSSVSVKTPAGKQIKGTLSADKTRWTSSEVLGYDKTYSVAAAAVNPDGRPATSTASFSTVKPRTFTMPSLFPGNSVKTVGIGQPITVHFDEPITDRVAAEKALSVEMTPKQEGGWNWFDSQNVHFRPKTYWKPGTKVTVRANVYGVNVGNGIWGQQDVSSTFTVGPARIATVDDDTHMMTVRIAGNVVRTIPVSMGRGGQITVKGQTIYFTTQSGPHVVQEKYPVKKMSSASYGLPVDDPSKLGYEEDIALAVRVSGSGEFVHSAPWSVGSQGVRNVSHGCLNISPANARWFYDNFTYGDIVDIKNTGVNLPPGDKFGDWMVSWATWVKGSALH